MYRKLCGKVEERVKSLENLERNRDGGKNHLILFSNLSTPLRKKQALFIISLFIVGWRKLRSSTLGINGMYAEVVSKSAEAQVVLLMKMIPTVWLRRQLRIQLPAAIWLKRFHNNFQESFQSLYVISRKERMQLFSASNQKCDWLCQDCLERKLICNLLKIIPHCIPLLTNFLVIVWRPTRQPFLTYFHGNIFGNYNIRIYYSLQYTEIHQ